jgi:hypothetical protein
MKAQLTFNDEETEILRMSLNGAEAHYALLAIDGMCRNWVKHYDLSEEEEKRLEEIRDQCREFVMN